MVVVFTFGSYLFQKFFLKVYVIFTYIFTISGAFLLSFLSVNPNFNLVSFSSILKKFFKHFLQSSLLVMTFFSFSMSEESFISSVLLFLKEISPDTEFQLSFFFKGVVLLSSSLHCFQQGVCRHSHFCSLYIISSL